MLEINVLVVEDESIVSKDIQHSLKKLGYSIIGAAASGEKAYELAITLNPDIILMDIMLKGEMNGIETVEKIRAEKDIPIIYLTAYADKSTLEKAKITEPHGYIIKPFKDVDLHTTIEMALYKFSKEKQVKEERDLFYSLIENKEPSSEFIFVKSKSKLVKIKNSDIFYIEALKDYVALNTIDNRYTVHTSMKDLASKLPSDQFIRVHRSYIVRIDKIVAIEYPNLLLENENKRIPIGGFYKDELMNSLNLI
ncbi:DNA-binding response regulator [Putridiphycobacter roseus]|uniref:DNA-binding response regulator n=1 Tax=Putridiphycobacter roseus TaxID=2219161 RepID=A0A2W1NES9_9FLAO|nr:response regulator [Putridiphycobacter roseus]PZE16566.1 DNA-binding response regulator [Putridiphycobacter roseus]